jgi:hypothetical protein
MLFVPIALQHIVIPEMDYQKKNRFALIFFFVVLTVLLAFRHETIGIDTVAYKNSFISCSNMRWGDIFNQSREVGFFLMNKIISLISREPQFYLAIIAISTIVLMVPTYYRLCLDSSLTLVLFCTMSTFWMAFSGIRQMLAIAIGFLSYKFVREKKIFWFIVTVVVATSIHTSAFILLFMYPLYYLKITPKAMLFVVPLFGALFVFNEQVFSFLLSILESHSRFSGTIESTGAYTMIILFALLSSFSFLIPDENLLDEETKGLRNFLLFAFLIQFFAPLNTLAMRMNYYYIIFIPLLMPKIIQSSSARWERVADVGRHIMVVVFFVYFFLLANSDGTLNVFPYHFFWERVA